MKEIRSKEHWKNIEAQVKLGNFPAAEFEALKLKSKDFAKLPDEEELTPNRIKD